MYLYLCVCCHNLNAINKCMENAWIIKRKKLQKENAASLSLFLLLIFKADYLQWRVKIQVKQTKARKFLPFTCLHVSVYVCMCVWAPCCGCCCYFWHCRCRGGGRKRKIVNNFGCKVRNMWMGNIYFRLNSKIILALTGFPGHSLEKVEQATNGKSCEKLLQQQRIMKIIYGNVIFNK